MGFNVLFIGCGNIAYRNFQGLLSKKIKLNIYLFDINNDNLSKFNKYFTRNNYFKSNIFFSNKINFKNKKFDLVLHCTTADVRLKYCKLISKQYFCRYIILEKILSNDIKSLLKIKEIFRNKKNVYVNTSRRSMNFYQKIKKSYIRKDLLGLEVIGGKWGLACNSIHFIDLMSWLVENNDYSIINHSFGRWYKSKRKGFYDITGKIIIKFGDFYLKLFSSTKKENNMMIFLKFKNREIIINESDMNCIIKQNLQSIKIDLQSELILTHLNNILLNKKLDLPKVELSVDQHIKYISFFNNVWNIKKNQSLNFVPIT